MKDIVELRTEPGSLLAAAPHMLDPNFMHTVVLMCQHSEKGAFGLVVNRVANVTIDRLLPEHPILSKHSVPVFQGGPVGLDTLQFLHTLPEEIPGGIELGDGLCLGGDLDALARFIAARGTDAQASLRLIVGYAGWGADQLEAELATGSWIPAQLASSAMLETPSELLWRRVLRSLGRDEVGLEDLPPDVTWN